MEKNIWFKAKRYGWGWYPASWEGWSVLFIWIVLCLQIFFIIDRNSHSMSDTLIGFSVPFLLLFVLFMFICWGTGERPQWRGR